MKIIHWGQQDYLSIFAAMRTFTEQRNSTTEDELWIVEHPPVYTLGIAGKPEHLLRQTNIPCIATDRGGQITYHGPGQLVVYTLLDIKRRSLGARQLVSAIEQSIITTLAQWNITGYSEAKRPGVYVDGAKIASLGLKIRHGMSYHGLALNIDMDMSPFTNINPCGYVGLRVTQLADLLADCPAFDTVATALCTAFIAHIDK